MEVAVLGAGAMGSLFGGLLADAGTDVTLLSRWEPHVDAIRERGLVVEDAVAPRDGRPDAPAERVVQVGATTDPAEAGAVDLVLVFVPSHATAAAMAWAAPLLGPATEVLTLQNGLDNADAIAEAVDPARVITGVTTHGAIRASPGRVRHTGRGETTVGRAFAGNDPLVSRVASLLSDAGIETGVTDDVRTAIWEKVLVNVGINAPTALARVPNGALAATDPGRRLVRGAVEEAAAVAREAGVDVRADVVAYALEVAETTAANRSSMRQDLEAARPTEVEALYGAVVERAEAQGRDVPRVRTLADLVRLAERGRACDDGARGVGEDTARASSGNDETGP